MESMTLFADIARTLGAVSMQAAVLGAVALAVDLAVRGLSARFRFWLWFVVLARLCIPLPLSLPAPVHEFLTGWMEREPAEEMVELDGLDSGLQRIPLAEPPNDWSFQPPMDADAPPPESGFSLPAIPVAPIAGMLWLAGMLSLMTVIAFRTRRMLGIVRASQPSAREDIRELTAGHAIKMGIRGTVEIRTAPDSMLATPAAVGAFRPRILLPASMAESWSADDLRPVLLHELAHIRRRDLWLNWLQIALQAVWFFHPAVWFTNHRLRRLREELCDDLAVSYGGLTSAAYSRSILKVVEHIAAQPSFGLVGLCIAERRSGAERRIRRLMAAGYRGAARLGVRGGIALGAVVVVGLVVSCAFGGKTKDTAESDNISESIVYLANAWGAQLMPPDDLKRALVNLSGAVNEHTNIDTKVDRHLYLDDRRIFDEPFVFITADSTFELTTIETVNLGNYLRNGGFAVVENGRPDLEYGPAEQSLRQMLHLALYDDAKFIPIPDDHPLYHCYFVFDDGPPLGSAPKIALPDSLRARGQREWSHMAPYLEGIWIDQRLVAIYSDFGYGALWVQDEGNEEQLKMGVNMVVFALAQEGGITQKRGDISVPANMEQGGSSFQFDEPGNIKEGTEQVRSNGRLLTRGVDYTIDYETGGINILNFDPLDDVEVTYEEREPIVIPPPNNQMYYLSPSEYSRPDSLNNQRDQGDELLNRARIEYRARRSDEAADLFEQYIEENPGEENNRYVLIQLGTALYNSGRASEAISVLNRLLEPADTDSTLTFVPFARYVKGLTLLEMGRRQEAISELQIIVERHSSDHQYEAAEALYWIGEIYVRENRYRDALATFERLLTDYPADAEPAVTHARRRIEELRERLNQPQPPGIGGQIPSFNGALSQMVLDNNPAADTEEGLFELGRDAYHEQLFHGGVFGQEARECVTIFERFLEQYPQSAHAPDVLLYLARVRFITNDMDAAIALLDRLANEYPRSELRPDAQYIRAVALSRNPADAISSMRAFLSEYPNSPHVPVGAAWIGEMLERQGNYREAFRQYETVAARYGQSGMLQGIDERIDALRDYLANGGTPPRLRVANVAPQVILGGLDEALIPAGCPLTTEQRIDILEHVPSVTSANSAFGFLTAQQKQAVVNQTKAHVVAGDGEPLNAEQMRMYLNMGPYSPYGREDILTDDQQAAISRSYDKIVAEEAARDATGNGEAAPPGETNDYFRGNDAYENRRYEDAVKYYESFIANNPASSNIPTALHQLAESNYSMGNLPEAIVTFDRLIDNYPDSGRRPDAMFQKSIALWDIRRPWNAIAELQKLLEQYPDAGDVSSRAAFSIGDIYASERRYEQALEQFETVIERYPTMEQRARTRIEEIREQLEGDPQNQE